GFTSPNKVRAITSPPRAPGYQASMTAAVNGSHGMRTGPPVSSTTTVRWLAATTAIIKLSWLSGSLRSDASYISAIHWCAKIITASDPFATYTARNTSSTSTYSTSAPPASASMAFTGEDG